MIDLIIFDLMGTLVRREGATERARKGTERFFKSYGERKIAVATDTDISSAEHYLIQLGIYDEVNAVFTQEDMVRVPRAGRRKNLRRICRELGVPLERAVFISDGDTDRKEARRVDMRFIHVPSYVNPREPFSFDRIDLSKRLAKYTDLRGVNPPFHTSPSETF